MGLVQKVVELLNPPDLYEKEILQLQEQLQKRDPEALVFEEPYFTVSTNHLYAQVFPAQATAYVRLHNKHTPDLDQLRKTLHEMDENYNIMIQNE